MDSQHRTFTFTVTIFSFLIFLAGLTSLIIGSVFISSLNYINLIGNIELDICIVLVLVGCITIITAFLGCFGAFAASSCVLYAFSCLLFVTLAMELGCSLAAFIYHDDIIDQITNNMNNSMYWYYNSSDSQNEWDDMQTTLSCCGTTGPGDWPKLKLPVPDSCCENVAPGSCNLVSNNIYRKGCVDAIYDAISENAWIIGGVALGITLIKITGLGLSCSLATKLKKQ